MLSGKAGIINVHLGGGKRKLELLTRIVEETEIPITQFLPTHANRTPELFEACVAFAKRVARLTSLLAKILIFGRRQMVKFASAKH